MKYFRERDRSSSQMNWTDTVTSSRSPMIDSYLTPPTKTMRSKSVLFSRRSFGESHSGTSSPTRQSRDSVNNDLLTSPRSDSSRGSKYTNKRSSSVTRTESAQIKTSRSRAGSVSSDDASTMDDNIPVRSAWSVFQEQIKSIDDTSDYHTQIQKPSFKSSDEFQKVMVDLYGNPEYGQKIGYTQLKGKVGNISAMASRMLARRRARKEDDSDEVDMYEMYQPSKATIENAKRGWRAIRRYIQEKVSENKCKDSNLKWTMLGQTLRGMSNAERTRMDLYQRYGIVPRLNPKGEYVHENSMLSEKARSMLRENIVREQDEGDKKRHPRTQLRARSSVLPRRAPNFNKSTASKQRPFYSRQRTLSLASKRTV